jgi:hypothetical protein
MHCTCNHVRDVGRIRLIWSRLWSIVSSHLVAAACHTSPDVASLGVEALAGLAARLLARLELSPFRCRPLLCFVGPGGGG